MAAAAAGTIQLLWSLVSPSLPSLLLLLLATLALLATPFWPWLPPSPSPAARRFAHVATSRRAALEARLPEITRDHPRSPEITS